MSHSAAAAKRKLARDVKRQARRKARGSILTIGWIQVGKTSIGKNVPATKN